MGLLDHALVERVVAETWVDMVIVAARIAVVGLEILVVEKHGRGPQGRDAEILEVVEVIDDALDVAAMAGEGYLAVAFFLDLGDAPRYGGAVVIGLGLGGPAVVVGRVAVGETVRHDQVDKIGRREALAT